MAKSKVAAKDAEVEIIDAAPEQSAAVKEPEVEIVKDAEAAKAAAEPADDGIARLKEQLAKEKQAREQAERERNEATHREQRAKVEKEDTEVRLFDGAVAQLKSNNAVLKQQFAYAMANNDYSAAADIQEALAANAAKMNDIEAGKQSLKDRPREQAAPLDPVEAFIHQNGIKGASARWLKDHPECVTDARLTRRMARAAADADDEGIEVNSKAYFEYVENRLGFNKAAPEADDEPLSQASAPSQRRSSPPAAPVSRDITPSGQKARVIRLTAEEAEIARMSDMTPQEYWNHKQAMN